MRRYFRCSTGDKKWYADAPNVRSHKQNAASILPQLGYKTSSTLATKSNEIHYFVASFHAVSPENTFNHKTLKLTNVQWLFLATQSNVSNYWYEY